MADIQICLFSCAPSWRVPSNWKNANALIRQASFSQSFVYAESVGRLNTYPITVVSLLRKCEYSAEHVGSFYAVASVISSEVFYMTSCVRCGEFIHTLAARSHGENSNPGFNAANLHLDNALRHGGLLHIILASRKAFLMCH